VGRQQDTIDRTTRILEGSGYLVTTTLSDAMAMDMAVSSDFDAVVVSGEVPSADSGYLRREIQSKKPATVVVMAHHPDSVVVQLNQAFKERESA
jgi:DNA-binding response OmpR family regulator